MQSGGVPPPLAPELRAAGLAAIAEAGLVYLPAHLVLSDAAMLQIGIVAGMAPFAVVYVVGVLLACRFRSSSNVTTAAGITALLAGLVLGGADLESTVLAVLVALLVTLRAVTLALRDWREPIHAEIGVGAFVLGVETMLAAGALPPWRTPLLVIVPVFFLASLASRATIVWAPVPEQDAGVERASWIRHATIATIALGAAMAAAAVLAVRGGVFERIGAWLSPVGYLVISVMASVLVVVVRPLLWALDRVGIDPAALRDLLEEWRRRAEANRAIEVATRPDAPWWSRLVPLLILVGIGWLLYRSLRRLRADVGSFERVGHRDEDPLSAPLPPDEGIIRRFLPHRSAPPADVVRRWYAEELLALRQRGLPKDAAFTPNEYVTTVVEAFPECAEGFRRLTRAYEDVRYGNRRITAEVLHRLEDDHRSLLGALHRPA